MLDDGVTTRDVHGNGNRISMGFPWEWEHKYAEYGNGNGNCKCDNGNGYFFISGKNSHGFANQIFVSVFQGSRVVCCLTSLFTVFYRPIRPTAFVIVFLTNKYDDDDDRFRRLTAK